MSATAAPGDLAALAEQWEGRASDLLREMGRSTVSVEEATANPLLADALKEAAVDLRAALDAHRCAPAVEVATSVAEACQDCGQMIPGVLAEHTRMVTEGSEGGPRWPQPCPGSFVELAPPLAAPPAEGEAASGENLDDVDLGSLAVTEYGLAAAYQQGVRHGREKERALRDASPAVEVES